MRLDADEHDAFLWATYDEAYRMCRPQVVADSFRIAVKAALGTSA